MGGIILRGDQYLMSGLDLYEAKLSLIWIFFPNWAKIVWACNNIRIAALVGILVNSSPRNGKKDDHGMIKLMEY